jgi:tRNA threonylcarbamoyl adenosine modification protein YeaZ
VPVLLLAFDTSTPAVTVALHDGSAVVSESTAVDARRHGELLAPGIAAALAAAGAGPRDLTAVAVGVGPGPFTGLRVGVVTARTLGAALGIAVHGICSLDALAWSAVAAGLDGPFAVVTDARRRELYWASYDRGGVREGVAGVDRPAEIAEQVGDRPVVGPGVELYEFADPRPAVLSAAALAELATRRLAYGGELLPPVPLYLRRPDATPPGERKRVLA